MYIFSERKMINLFHRKFGERSLRRGKTSIVILVTIYSLRLSWLTLFLKRFTIDEWIYLYFVHNIQHNDEQNENKKTIKEQNKKSI